MTSLAVFCAASVTFGCLALGCSSSAPEADGSGPRSGGAGVPSSDAGATSNGGGSPAIGAGATGGTVTLEPGQEPDDSDVNNGECAQQSFVLTSKPADVLLVLDRSKSMIEHTVPPLDQTRWDAVVDGLTAVITATDASVSWGLKLFPEGEGSSCDAASVTDAVPVPIAVNNAPNVNAQIAATMALGNGTPTGDAIKKATAYLTSRNATNQYLVLATDGEPSCPNDDDGDALDYAIDAIEAAKAAGFPTYVIGVVDAEEDDDTARRLDAMAEAGGTARAGAAEGDRFYAAYSQDALSLALTSVAGQVVSCSFVFDGPPPDPSNIAVKLNGARLEQDTSGAGGWDYTDDAYGGLQLQGDACQAIKDGTATQLDVVFGCKGQPIK